MGMMLTVTGDGQVLLQKDVLKHLGAEPGDRVAVELLPGGRAEVRVVPGGRITDFFGCLAGPDTRTVSIDEMNEAAAAGWAGEP